MSRYQGSCPLDCKVYVGGLTKNASREEIERAFAHYGKLRNVFVARNPPGFAFIEFQDPQDAEDSVRALDGRVLCGVRVRVEISHGKSRDKGPMKRSGGDSGRRRRSRSLDRRRNSYSSRSSSRSRGDRNGNGAGYGMGAGGGGMGGRDYNGRDRDRESNRRRFNHISARSRSRS